MNRLTLTILFAAWMLLGILTPAEAQSTKKTTTAKRTIATENQVLDIISDLPEVKQLRKDIERLSKGQRSIIIVIMQNPTKDDPHYWVYAAEDLGWRLIVYYTFLFNPHTLAIKCYDFDGTIIDLSVWRQRNTKRKK